jgi:hypothetical protein
MDWIKRLERWQRLWAAFSIVGLVVTGGVVFQTSPQANPVLAKQLTSAECLPVRALPANEINPHGLSKERYALYLQCADLFWYRARYPESQLTLLEYQQRLETERTRLLTRALSFWLLGIALFYVVALIIVRTLGWTRRGSDTPDTVD